MKLTEFTTRNVQMRKVLNILREQYKFTLDTNTLTRTKAKRLSEKATSKMKNCSDMNLRIKYRLIAEAATIWHEAITSDIADKLSEGLDDDAMEEAKVILAAKEISDKIQSMIEDAAKMQVQDLLPIVDAMKSEVGSAEASAFSSAADAALQGLVESLKTAKEEYDNAIAGAQGESVATDMGAFGDETGDDSDMDMGDPDMDMDMAAQGDDDEMFGGDAANMGDESPEGRKMKDEF
jgi:hypothetical protein